MKLVMLNFVLFVSLGAFAQTESDVAQVTDSDNAVLSPSSADIKTALKQKFARFRGNKAFNPERFVIQLYTASEERSVLENQVAVKLVRLGYTVRETKPCPSHVESPRAVNYSEWMQVHDRQAVEYARANMNAVLIENLEAPRESDLVAYSSSERWIYEPNHVNIYLCNSK